MTTCSVLICTYNRPEMLARCLTALIERTDEKPDQIVVVNGGDRRSDIVVENYIGKQGAQVELVKAENKNLAANRNVGLPYCIGDIIAMTDDDAEVFPDWVTRIKQVHCEHPEAGAVGGPVIGVNSESIIGRISDRVTFSSSPKASIVRTLPGVNVSYKKKVIALVGLQDEMFYLNCGEDVDYNWRVKKLGYEVYYDPTIRVFHQHRATLKAFLRQHYNYGRSYYLVRNKWPEMYCVYPHKLQRPKDFLKAINFVVAMFYEPFQYAVKMERVADKVLAMPVLLLNGLGWRGGMIRQKLSTRKVEQAN